MPQKTQGIRPAFLAGQWYPDDPEKCRLAIIKYTTEFAIDHNNYHGLIAPHAGWDFSGQTAARGYAALAHTNSKAELVVMFGSHRGAHGPNTIFCGDQWQTPLGNLTNASEYATYLAELLSLSEEPVMPPRPDNAVELHLPMVRYFFPQAKLLMLGVAAAPIAIDIGNKIGDFIYQKGLSAVFVGSTDLTHYGPNYGFMPHGLGKEAVNWVRNQNDHELIEHVLSQNLDEILAHADLHHSACCPGAIAATLAATNAYGQKINPKLIEYSQSCDFYPSSSFVGYASIVL